MKYCLNATVAREYLIKADELKIDWADVDKIIDLIDINNTANIIVEINNPSKFNPKVDIDRLKTYNTLCDNKLYIGLPDMSFIDYCKEAGVKYFMLFPFRDFYTIQWFLKNGVSYLRLAPPLTHELPTVSKLKVPIRAIANIAYSDGLPREEDCIYGQWIRPEDIKIYEQYVSVIEFAGVPTSAEQALYRIYAEQNEWPGQMSTIFRNFNVNAINRLIDPSLAEHRINCGQRCMADGGCRLCYYVIRMANDDLKQVIAE